MAIKVENIITIILLLLLASSSLRAQDNSKNKLIDISRHNATLRQILDDITAQSGILFAYNTNLIDDQTTLDIKVRRKPIADVMTQISEMLGFEYIHTDKQIILKPYKESIKSNKTIEKPHNTSIYGYIKDSKTHEPLIGATISVEGMPIGTLSNDVGYYVLTLPKGTHTLIFSYLGYRRKYIDIELNGNITINEDLDRTTTQLEAISITSNNKNPGNKSMLNKSSDLNAADFIKYSGLVLGGDLVGILATDHGITRISDGSAFYSVRGGYKDQNLVLIDDAPIYHPSHLFGLFSSVAPQSINSIEVYTSDFPLKYGGRLSSVTDIRTKDGSLGKLAAGYEITPLTTSIRLEAPIYNNKITATANFRKSLLGWGGKLLDINGDFSFYDFHSKIHFKISQKDRIYISIFSGNDYYSNIQTSNNYAVSWNNIATTLRHYRAIGTKMYMNQTFYFGRYKYIIYTAPDHRDYWNTRIGNIAYKTDFSWEPSPKTTFRFGGEYSYHIFNPATLYTRRKKTNSGPVTGNADNIVAYIGTEIQATEKIAFKIGARFSLWNNYGPATNFSYDELKKQWNTILHPDSKRFNTFKRIEPRLTAIYRINKRLNIKFSGENIVQYLHMLSNTISPFTTLDLWIPSGSYFQPQEVYTTTGTILLKLRETTLTTCVYHKMFKNVTEYKLHANMLMNPNIENEFYLGKAQSTGVELSAEKKLGKLKMKSSYSYNYSKKYTPELYNYQYTPDNSIPHSLHIMMQYNFTERFVCKADWNFSSGIPYTKPIGFYNYEGYQIPYYGDRNNTRLPNYHKLNIAAEYTFRRPEIRHLTHKISFSIYNVYNRKNFVLVSYNKIQTSDGKFVIPSDYSTQNHFVATGMSLPGIFPMLSYQVQFQH
jgi:hypothetical protein